VAWFEVGKCEDQVMRGMSTRWIRISRSDQVQMHIRGLQILGSTSWVSLATFVSGSVPVVTSRWRISRSTATSRALSSAVTSLISLTACTGKGLASARETVTEKVILISACQEITRENTLTEGEEREEGDDKSRALHVEGGGVERRERKVVS